MDGQGVETTAGVPPGPADNQAGAVQTAVGTSGGEVQMPPPSATVGPEQRDMVQWSKQVDAWNIEVSTAVRSVQATQAELSKTLQAIAENMSDGRCFLCVLRVVVQLLREPWQY